MMLSLLFGTRLNLWLIRQHRPLCTLALYVHVGGQWALHQICRVPLPF